MTSQLTSTTAAWRGPLLTGLVGAAALAAVALRDPHVAGSFGMCPFLAITGLPCAGCGGLRATHDLLHGDLSAALGQNVLAVVVVVTGLVLWVRWTLRRSRGTAAPFMELSSAAALALVVALCVFAAARWTAWGAVLGPTLT